MAAPAVKRYQAPALDKGLDILEYLSAQAVPQSQAEIAHGLRRGPNEIYRMLIVLEQRGYLNRDESSGKYRLSLKLYHLAHTHSPLEQLRHAAAGPMEELAGAIDQSCHLGVLYNNRLMIIAQTRSPGPVSLSVAEGTMFHLSTTVSGRVLLSHSDPVRERDLLSQDPDYRRMTKSRRQRLLTRVAQIRKQGYDLAPSEYTEGVTDCAALVGDARSDLVAALAVSSLTTSLSRSLSKKKLIAAVRAAAQQINHSIGAQ